MPLFTNLNAFAIFLSTDLPEPGDPEFDGGFGTLPMPADPTGTANGMEAMSAINVVMTLLVIAGIGIAIWRFWVTTTASKELGLGGAGTFLALTDENATTAFLAGAAVKASQTGAAPVQDFVSRLEGLQAALDKGLISADEFATKRVQILHDA